MRAITFAVCLWPALVGAAACPPDLMDGGFYGDASPRDPYCLHSENSWAIVAANPGRVIDSKIKSKGDPESGGGIAGGGPSELGQWSSPQSFPVVAIHASMLHTGEVVAWAYPGTNQAKVWNPSTN